MISNKIILKDIKQPEKDCTHCPIHLSDETIKERFQKVLTEMKKRLLDKIIIYSDVEHNGNFMYLIGYFPRFEEAVMVLNADGTAYVLLGNENLNKASKARITVQSIHASVFSLPFQPNRTDKTFKELLEEAGISKNDRIGIVGWKVFTSAIEDNKFTFDVPYYIVDTIHQIVENKGNVTNETDIFIGDEGVRNTNNANEIAHYEYGASLASDGILEAMNRIDIGVTEIELGNCLSQDGQHHNVVTIATSGERFVKANMFPTANTVKLADPISLTVGYIGGLSSRAGFAVHQRDELPKQQSDYLEKVAIPYFNVYTQWLENLKIGMKGGELYNFVETIFPKAQYGWTLCPGHLTAEEEWMTSPVYNGSQVTLKSGMIFQVDIIPSISGYNGVSAESTVVLADEKLRDEIKRQYPEMWERMQARVSYLKNILGINLSQEVLPMCSTVGYLRPFLLDKKKALIKEQ